MIERFGSTVADLVDGVSKLDRLQFSSTEQAQAENFRKMLLAMARDVRVMLIKLADRLHNMRTLEAVDTERRRRIARETLEIYAPIAHRLGLNTLFRELEELSFEHLYPLRYQVLNRAVLAARGNRREVLGKMMVAVRKSLADAKLKAEVQGREKTVYGIYRKMADKRLSFSQVLDIYGFRVVVDTPAQCYLALGTLHSLYKPVPGKFKDYIAIPKVNGYQSLHTTLIGPYGTPVEFQIRTKDMHHVAETGVAAHWLYKDDDSDLSELQSRTHQWLQSLLEIQRQTGDSSEFLEHIKVDLFPGQGLHIHSEGPHRRAAARCDARGLRLQHPHRRRQQDRCGPHQQRDPAAAHATEKRRHGRNRHRARSETQSCMGVVRQNRQGAIGDSAFSAHDEVRRVGRAG